MSEEKTGCCVSCFSCCAGNKEDDDHFYNSDEEKGVEDEGRIHPDFKEKIKPNKASCRIKKKRRCVQDVWCTIIFIAFIIGMIAVAVIACLKGDPRRLYMPTDYIGRVCGKDNSQVPNGVFKLPNDDDCRAAAENSKNTAAAAACEAKVAPYKEDLTSRPYLWFMDVTEAMTYGGVCVSYCPGMKNTTSTETYRFCPPELNQNETFKVLGLGGYPFCSFSRADHNVSFPPTTNTQLLESLLQYSPVLNRCIPSLKYLNKTLQEQFSTILKSDAIEGIINEASDAARTLWGDIYRAWRILIIVTFGALFIAFAFLLLVRIFTAIMVWVIVVACGLCLAGLSGLMIWQGYMSWQDLKAKELSTTLAQVIFYIGIGLGGLTILYVFLVFILMMRIRKAIGIIQEACKAVGTIPTLVFVPVITGLLMILFMVYWVIIAVFLWSSGTPSVSSAGFAVRYTFDNFTRGIFAYHIFGMLWIINFFIAFEFVVISGAIGSWYWRRDKRFRLKDPVVSSFFRTLLYQTGSIIAGSLIVAIIQFIRLVFERAYRNLKKAQADNKLVQGLAWAVRIFLFLFEMVIKYINKHAYIQMALYGTSFIFSARNAFLIITRNIVQLGVLDTISAIVLMLGRITIAFATAILAYGLCRIPILVEDREAISTPLLVAAVAFVIGFSIASLFMVVFGCAIDTILQCFLIDNEMFENSSENGYTPYCTSSLRKFMDEAKALESLSTCTCCPTRAQKAEVKKKQEDYLDVASPATTF